MTDDNHFCGGEEESYSPKENNLRLRSVDTMARKRQRRRPAGDTATDHQGHHDGSLVHHVHVNGDRVKVHQISAQDEGLLYTHRIMVSHAYIFFIDFITIYVIKFYYPTNGLAIRLHTFRNDEVGSIVEY